MQKKNYFLRFSVLENQVTICQSCNISVALSVNNLPRNIIKLTFVFCLSMKNSNYLIHSQKNTQTTTIVLQKKAINQKLSSITAAHNNSLQERYRRCPMSAAFPCY